jgi:hypothetical protein
MDKAMNPQIGLKVDHSCRELSVFFFLMHYKGVLISWPGSAFVRTKIQPYYSFKRAQCQVCQVAVGSVTNLKE